ncbi:TPA: phage tail protein [Providencia stuartii]|uniref:phage tail protein n=1 Tax=Providencia TaxID=586 RepID=UPI00197EB40A|nr:MULTISPECIES: phage tail protein [Providencia]MBN5602923.1 phage tail protein [Providencia stuartii]MBN5606969.1 phage tail protein [Providencia stuartii]HEM6912679.1 phage tail protein [Providencia stuartii]HEM7145939.1 phage tail protein [Providencia stuartii]HEM7164560.1 phage tail protein [Providencia stuartii]
MTPIFNWVPQKDYTVTETPNVSVVTFGDGYEQRQQKGINPLLSKYSALTFIGVDGLCGKPNIAKEVRAFLKERGAVESFFWTPSDTGQQGRYVCRSWSYTKNGIVHKLIAEFEEVVR